MIVDVAPGATFVLVLAQTVGHQLAQIPASGSNSEIVILNRIGQQLLHFLIDGFGQVVGKQLFAKIIVGADIDSAQRVVNHQSLQVESRAYALLIALKVHKVSVYFILKRFIGVGRCFNLSFPSRIGGHGSKQGKHSREYDTCTFHCLVISPISPIEKFSGFLPLKSLKYNFISRMSASRSPVGMMVFVH